MNNFSSGDKLNFTICQDKQKTNAIFVLDDFIARGGQAEVYSSHLNGSSHSGLYVVKYLFGGYSCNKKKYYQKLSAMARFSAPDPGIVWPLGYTTQTESGCFAYLMPRLNGYLSAASIINKLMRYDGGSLSGASTLTPQQRAELAYKTAAMLDHLHKSGFLYGDISGSNVQYRLRPDGLVSARLIDGDNVIIIGEKTPYDLGLRGTGLYTAPEMFVNNTPPTVQTDLHALGVLAFRLMVGAHPLDGEHARTLPLTEENKRIVYGKEATFAPTSRTNRPSDHIMKRWNQLPDPLKEYFKRMFRKDALCGRQPRPTASELMQAIQRSYPNLNTDNT
jgi:serine/threonine protein kinase